jgi:deoxyribodipyrimidine photo-lyase
VVVAADHGPYGRERDRQVAAALEADGRRLLRYGTPYAVAPGTLKNGRGDRFKVFTPFYKAWRHRGWPAPIDAPTGLDVAEPPRKSWRLPGKALATSDALLPDAGEEGAAAALERFLDRVAGYDTDRDRPDLDRTSRLSPYLKYGCVHPRQILARLERGRGPDTFRKELAWREFYADVLAGIPESARESLQPDMQKMEWDEGREADERFDAWRDGRTGYPIVDAGMRQLRAEAWMHNRVRMIVASFLVKDLHLDWRRGARHFMQLLVDGDLASNQHGWQWTAGTGTDPAPFFRVFNPLLQGRKFDPDGEYVRRWVPELSGVTGADVHEPWSLAAGPPAGYPAPIVDHAAERREALARYAELREG